MDNKKKKICLAATTGGHFEQILRLKMLKDKYDLLFFTNNCHVSKESGIPSYKVFSPNMHNKVLRLFGMIINSLQSCHFLLKYKPDVIISTGSGEMYPLLWFGKKIFKKKIIFIESFAKVNSCNKTGIATYKFADVFIVQWESMLQYYPNAKYYGGIY